MVDCIANGRSFLVETVLSSDKWRCRDGSRASIEDDRAEEARKLGLDDPNAAPPPTGTIEE